MWTSSATSWSLVDQAAACRLHRPGCSFCSGQSRPNRESRNGIPKKRFSREKRGVSVNSAGFIAGGLQASVSVVRLQVFLVQLLLGFVQLAELLGLTFAQLLPVSVVSGEPLEEQPRSHVCLIPLSPRILTVGSNLEYFSVSARKISDAGIFILASLATWNGKRKRWREGCREREHRTA